MYYYVIRVCHHGYYQECISKSTDLLTALKSLIRDGGTKHHQSIGRVLFYGEYISAIIIESEIEAPVKGFAGLHDSTAEIRWWKDVDKALSFAEEFLSFDSRGEDGGYNFSDTESEGEEEADIRGGARDKVEVV
jgi:hypothetical protein